MLKKTEAKFQEEKDLIESKLNILVLDNFSNYKNNKSKFRNICNSCGANRNSSWSDLLSGHGCIFCSNRKTNEKRKLTRIEFEESIKMVEDLSSVRVLADYNDFVGVRQKLRAVCLLCGRETFFCLAERKRGRGCKFCAGNVKISEVEYLSRIKEIEEKIGIVVESNFSIYKNKKTLLSFRCKNCGKVSSRSLDFIERSKGCPSCAKNAKKDESWNLEMVKKAEGQGLLFQGDIGDICGIKKKIPFLCLKCGYTVSKTALSISRGTGCSVCSRTQGLSREQYEEAVTKIREKNKIQVLTPHSEYKGTSSPISCLCLVCNNEIFPSLHNLLRGSGCSECAKHLVTSTQESEISEFVSAQDPDLKIQRNIKILGRQEIDIFIPEKMVGLEYNGLYWHSEKFLGKRKHLEKYLAAKEKGIRLIQIFGDEWADKKEIVQSIVLNSLGLSVQRYDARKCKVVLSDSSNRSRFEDFFETNHISGNARFFYAAGLELDGELVQAVSLRRPFIKKYGKVLELARSCVKCFCTVRGGFAKLLSVVREEFRSDTILSYADLRFGDGNVYLKNGFELVGRTPPDYSYTDFQRRYNRFQYRAQGAVSEKEVAEQNGVVKIFGTGSNIYLLKPSA